MLPPLGLLKHHSLLLIQTSGYSLSERCSISDTSTLSPSDILHNIITSDHIIVLILLRHNFPRSLLLHCAHNASAVPLMGLKSLTSIIPPLFWTESILVLVYKLLTLKIFDILLFQIVLHLVCLRCPLESAEVGHILSIHF